MRGIPHIRFCQIAHHLHIECDGETVGIFIPDLLQRKGEKFMERMEKLKMLVSDELVDSIKYLDEISLKEQNG